MKECCKEDGVGALLASWLGANTRPRSCLPSTQKINSLALPDHRLGAGQHKIASMEHWW